MKRHISQKKKSSVKTKLLAIAVLLTFIFLSCGITLAAYVSRSYVKGVATTPKYGFELSSDYLSVVPKNSRKDSYPVRKIMFEKKADNDDTSYKFTFSVSNSGSGTISEKEIGYHLIMSDLPEGADVEYDGKSIVTQVKTEVGYPSKKMPAYSSVTHTYTVTIPKSSLTTAQEITVKVIPDDESAISGYILAAKIQPSITGKVASFSHSGVLTDSVNDGNINNYSAFNYQISVINAGANRPMKLTWNKDVIELDPLFINYLKDNKGIDVEQVRQNGEVIFSMSDNESYLIQFYRMPASENQTVEGLGITFRPESE